MLLAFSACCSRDTFAIFERKICMTEGSYCKRKPVSQYIWYLFPVKKFIRNFSAYHLLAGCVIACIDIAPVQLLRQSQWSMEG